MKSIFDFNKENLIEYFSNIGEKKFVATQIFDWIYLKRITNYDNMSNIKKSLISFLKSNLSLYEIKIVKRQEDNLTRKYLFELIDHNYIEAVLMHHEYGYSLCVSSQVGCNMGCAFCESGRLKKIRNLETHEMVEQILLVEKRENIRISSVVIMGIGEPLDNYDNVIDFIKIINDPKGIAIGARHITLSTCGLIPKIKELASLPLQINLAISLHAADNDTRNRIMSVNKVYNINELIATIKEYIATTNRRVTIEYVMLNGINDSLEAANNLADLLKGMNVYVNLIPYNETNHLEFKTSPKDQMLKFYDCLKKHNITVTIRRSFGKNIDAACGQLRSKEV